MGKHGKDAIIDKNCEKIIFGDYRENDLAKWIRKLNRDRLILSRETLYALKNAGFPFAKYSNKQAGDEFRNYNFEMRGCSTKKIRTIFVVIDITLHNPSTSLLDS